MHVQYQSQTTANTANTVIPANAGIQYANSGVRALLESPRLRWQVNATTGLHFTDWVLDSRLRGNDGQLAELAHVQRLGSHLHRNDGQRPSTQRLRCPLFLWMSA